MKMHFQLMKLHIWGKHGGRSQSWNCHHCFTSRRQEFLLKKSVNLAVHFSTCMKFSLNTREIRKSPYYIYNNLWSTDCHLRKRHWRYKGNSLKRTPSSSGRQGSKTKYQKLLEKEVVFMLFHNSTQCLHLKCHIELWAFFHKGYDRLREGTKVYNDS